MVSKTYCDICNNEIKLRDAYYFKISPIAMSTVPVFSFAEICKECRDKIILITDRIKTDREAVIKFINRKV